METTIGEVLENARHKKGLRKSDICEGICNLSTYMRYEDDIISTDRFVLDVLLERLGVNPNKIIHLASAVELEIISIRNSILNLIKECKYNDAERLIKKYEYLLLHVKNKKLHQQYCEYCKAEIARRRGYLQDAYEGYVKAFSITRSYSRYSSVISKAYSEVEFILLFRIIMIDEELKYKLNELKLGLDGLEDNDYIKIVFYGQVVKELAHELYLQGNKKRAIKYLNEGIEYKRKNYQFVGLKELLNEKQLITGELDENEKMIISITL